MAIESNNRTLIHAGGLFNARVYKVAHQDGTFHIEKDFSASPWPVRNTVGRFLIWREAWILRYLEHKTAIVPGGVRILSPFCLREDFCRGKTLHEVRDAATPADLAPGETPDLSTALPHIFFEMLACGVDDCHRAHFVHLDLHNSRNVMVDPDGHPVIIDWQSALPTFLVLPPLRHALERIDLAGVYKFWQLFRPRELTSKQTHFLEHSRFIRQHFWFPRLHHTLNHTLH